jgi:hypothetical protein
MNSTSTTDAFKNVPALQSSLSQKQRKNITLLLEQTKNETVSVCYLEPEVDILSPYEKATTYPVYPEHKRQFCLGIEKPQKFLWFRWSSFSVIGVIEWEFRDDGNFKKLHIKYYGNGRKQMHNLIRLLDKLQHIFDCQVTLSSAAED